MSLKEQIAEFERRSARARAMGSVKRLAERAAAGILNARQRIDHLVEPDSFEEFGLFAASLDPAMREKTPADSAVCGFGRVDGRLIGINSADFTTLGASSSRVQVKKYNHIRDLCIANGHPLINLMECAGGRIPDIMGAAGQGGGGESGRYCRERVVPTASAALGLTYGRGAFVCVNSDFTVMRKGAVMAVSSPMVTSVAIAEGADLEELGGWQMHSAVTGIADMVVDTDEEALEAIRRFLSYMPDHNRTVAARTTVEVDSACSDEILGLVPAQRHQVYDVRKVIKAIVDRDSFFPLKERFGKVVVTGLARLDGRTIGVIATNPMFKGGAIDPEGCGKIATFIVLCDSFNIPIVLLADTPGFLVGVESERRGLAGHIMNMLSALEQATVPKFAVILRKSFGQAYINMGGGKADETAAWCNAEISFMDPAVAVNVVYAIREEENPMQFRELLGQVSRETTAYDLAAPYLAHAVIDPRETRRYLRTRLEIHSRSLSGGIGEHRLANWPPMLL